MFATLAGGLPDPGIEERVGRRTLERVVADQRAAGLEPIGDGFVGWPAGSVVGTALALGGRVAALPDDERSTAPAVRFDRAPVEGATTAIVERWRETARLAAPAAAKAILGGPYSIAALAAEDRRERIRLAHRLAEVLNAPLRALEAAGCPLVQIDEPAVTQVGATMVERRAFVEIEERLLAGLTRLHVSLAVIGGSADSAGPATLFEPPYRSYLVDLIEGPDNWRLVAEAPADRGIVCGVVPTGTSLGPVNLEVLVYAAHYAAATHGRGLARVGLATAGSLAGLPYDEAMARMRFLAAGAAAAEAAARGEAEATRRLLDRRSWDLRAGGRRLSVRPTRRAIEPDTEGSR